MKKGIALIALVLLTSFYVSAQDFTKASDSDPAATAVLKKLKSKYEAYQSLQASFKLEIAIPEQPVEVQQGTVARSGDKYKFEVGKQLFISDGKTLWIVLGQNKEVQINDVPDEDEAGILSPSSLFTFYESDEFVYFLTDERMDNGKLIQQIEFKPLDEYSDYSKIRMTVDKRKNEIIRIRTFGKDGTRYAFSLSQFKANPSLSASYFTFDKSKYSDYSIVDLRL